MIVIDASVAFKLINTQEEGSDKARFLFSQHYKKQNKIIVPSLLYLEVANALVTKAHLTSPVIGEGMKLLNDFDLTIHSFTKNDFAETARLAKQYKTTVYDMLYAVIAKAEHCTLVTADVSFFKKTKFPFVQLLDTIV